MTAFGPCVKKEESTHYTLNKRELLQQDLMPPKHESMQ